MSSMDHHRCRSYVMPALGAGIHVFLALRRKDVDGRNKSGHDD
jgi:hypothetical protein